MHSVLQLLTASVLLLASLTDLSTATNLNICNHYAPTVYIDWDANPGMRVPGHVEIGINQCHIEAVEPGWSGAFFAGLVPNDKSNHDWRSHDTKVEFTMRGFVDYDYLDVDLEHGQSVPVIAQSSGFFAGCGVDKLQSCPPHLLMWDEGWPVQCRNDQSPEAIQHFRQGCPNVYVLYNDDRNTKTAFGRPDVIDVDIRVVPG